MKFKWLLWSSNGSLGLQSINGSHDLALKTLLDFPFVTFKMVTLINVSLGFVAKLIIFSYPSIYKGFWAQKLMGILKGLHSSLGQQQKIGIFKKSSSHLFLCSSRRDERKKCWRTSPDTLVCHMQWVSSTISSFLMTRWICISVYVWMFVLELPWCSFVCDVSRLIF